MKSLFKNKLVTALVSIFFGIALMVWHGEAPSFFIRILGWLMIAAAAVNLIRFFLPKNNRNPSLMIGTVLFALFGLFLLISPTTIVNFFPIVMGIILVLNGLADLIQSISLKKGALYYILAVIIMLLGILVVMNPTAIVNYIVLLIGASYLANGVVDVIFLVTTRKMSEHT